MRHLILVLGDQLDRNSAAFDDFDPEQDSVWMAETAEEVTHVWCHKLRIAAFFSAMRHFRDELRERDLPVLYHELTSDPDEDVGSNFAEVLAATIKEERPNGLVVVHPGDYRVLTMLKEFAEENELPLDIRPDRHFISTVDEFRAWSKGRKELRLEYWYRQLRKDRKILIDADGNPEGGEWNYDSENRDAFDSDGPGEIKAPRRFCTDDLTDAVIELVNERFADHPGSLAHFDLPVTHEQALALLRDFIEHRLPKFGTYQDAMWTGRPFLYHSRLSFVLNVHLLDPLKCVEDAVTAYEEGSAPLASVEGFVRQILGWREFVRGIYWTHMPQYAERNALRCDDVDVPPFFWDGDTEMACVQDAMQGVVDHAYAHHIHRLMVLGLFAQLYGVHPYKFHEWHMAMYADAIDWVSLPNTLGMSQYGDGGIVGSKPYCASGNYINRMGNYCAGCKYNPKEATGEDACPFTTLYWSFLDRHSDQFSSNHRMGMQLKNWERKKGEQQAEIRKAAETLREKVAAGDV